MRGDAARDAEVGRAATPGRMGVIRIWADDLTGALDTSAQFTGVLGPLPVLLRGAPAEGSAAWDNASRDEPWETALSRIADIVAFLRPADLPYLKVDSLLRGHSLKDVAATFAQGKYRRCILAPAFPTQGRVTRGGVQLWRDAADHWQPVGPSIVDAMRRLGMLARLAPTPADIDGDGIIVCDADGDGSLVEIAGRGRGLAAADDGRLLWCGSAGLASALAGCAPTFVLPQDGPLLLVIGSAHPQSRLQLDAFRAARGGAVIEASDVDPSAASSLARAFARQRLALLAFQPPIGCDEAAAMRFIRAELAKCLPALGRPGTLVVSGGETLRAVCEILGADRLVVCGQVQPGFPVARLVGGLWDGLLVVSKSGAFGDAQTLVELAKRLVPEMPILHGDGS